MIKEAAINYYSQGYNVLPVSKSKAPTTDSWKLWQTERQPSVEQIFNGSDWGVAVISGFNKIEVLDIDVKNDPDGTIAKRFSEALKAAGIDTSKFTLSETQSKGYHLIYRTNDPGRNTVLARVKHQDGTYKTVIETRSDGGIFVLPPSPGYTFLRGDLSTAPLIDDEERELIFRIAQSFNEYKIQTKSYGIQDLERVSAWQEFNSKHDYLYLQEKLEWLGWTEWSQSGTNIYYTRPGKKGGISGDINMEINVFKSFSSNGLPFEQDIAYTPFDVYALLEHDGDGKKAARTLYHEGYGDRFEKEEKETKGIYTFDPNNPPPNLEPCMWRVWNDKQYPFVTMNAIMSLAGRSGVGKSTVLQAFIANALSGKHLINIKVYLNNKDIIVVDTEQSEPELYTQGCNIMKMVGTTKGLDRYYVFGIADIEREKNDKRRMAAIRREEIDRLIDKHEGEIGMLIIDNVRDMVNNYNDVDSAIEFADWVKMLRKKTGALIVLVIHTTKTNDEMKGNLGTIMDEISSTYIKVVGYRDEEYSEIKPMKTRGFKPFPAVSFGWDDRGLPILFSGTEYGVFRKTN